MAKAKKAQKEFRTKIAEQLTVTFGELKQRISEKKFERSIRKASKILSRGFKETKAEKTEGKDSKKKSATSGGLKASA